MFFLFCFVLLIIKITILDCDWFKELLFSSNSLAKLLSDSSISQLHSKLQFKSTNHIQSCSYGRVHACIRSIICYHSYDNKLDWTPLRLDSAQSYYHYLARDDGYRLALSVPSTLHRRNLKTEGSL